MLKISNEIINKVWNSLSEYEYVHNQSYIKYRYAMKNQLVVILNYNVFYRTALCPNTKDDRDDGDDGCNDPDVSMQGKYESIVFG